MKNRTRILIVVVSLLTTLSHLRGEHSPTDPPQSKPSEMEFPGFLFNERQASDYFTKTKGALEFLVLNSGLLDEIGDMDSANAKKLLSKLEENGKIDRKGKVELEIQLGEFSESTFPSQILDICSL